MLKRVQHDRLQEKATTGKKQKARLVLLNAVKNLEEKNELLRSAQQDRKLRQENAKRLLHPPD